MPLPQETRTADGHHILKSKTVKLFIYKFFIIFTIVAVASLTISAIFYWSDFSQSLVPCFALAARPWPLLCTTLEEGLSLKLDFLIVLRTMFKFTVNNINIVNNFIQEVLLNINNLMQAHVPVPASDSASAYTERAKQEGKPAFEINSGFSRDWSWREESDVSSEWYKNQNPTLGLDNVISPEKKPELWDLEYLRRDFLISKSYSARGRVIIRFLIEGKSFEEAKLLTEVHIHERNIKAHFVFLDVCKEKFSEKYYKADWDLVSAYTSKKTCIPYDLPKDVKFVLTKYHNRIYKSRFDMARAVMELERYREQERFIKKSQNLNNQTGPLDNLLSEASTTATVATASSTSNSSSLNTSINQNFLFLALFNIKLYNRLWPAFAKTRALALSLYSSPYFKNVALYWLALNLAMNKSNNLDFTYCLGAYLNAIYPALFIFFLILNFLIKLLWVIASLSA